MNKRIALLSNINVTPIARNLRENDLEVWEASGYGDIFGPLMNPSLKLHDFDPTEIFIVVDLTTMIKECRSLDEAKIEIDRWFHNLISQVESYRCFYISNGVCRYTSYFEDREHLSARDVESYWNTKLSELIEKQDNVYVFPYAELAFQLGFESFFSDQLWYLARLPFTAKGQGAITEKIATLANTSGEIPKKAMIVDLDNTLWGGVVGEEGPLGVDLSDEHSGLAYKDIQRSLRSMADAGVILCIASKNNQKDVMEVFDKNPSMILSKDDFAAARINWNRKDQSIRELSEELNLGIDSFAFLDDNPAERELIAEVLPEVLIVDFPSDITTLPSILRNIYEDHFRQSHTTIEDREKTRQYLQNAERSAYEKETRSFEDYLMGLEIEVSSVDPLEHVERITQLVGKTNQFNLTTKRYSQQEIRAMIEDPCFDVFAFNVSDRFGDSGLTAVVILDFNSNPVVDTFLMSCRIMGRCIENSIIDFIEESLTKRGYDTLDGIYAATEKNAPVENLYGSMGYKLVDRHDKVSCYTLNLNERPKRRLYTKEISE